MPPADSRACDYFAPDGQVKQKLGGSWLSQMSRKATRRRRGAALARARSEARQRARPVSAPVRRRGVPGAGVLQVLYVAIVDSRGTTPLGASPLLRRRLIGGVLKRLIPRLDPDRLDRQESGWLHGHRDGP